MKLPSLFPAKKLRATTARRSLGVPDEMDYEEMSEPNMKLSRALLIVLVLHVVAVAGIIAFNTIKSRQASIPPVSSPKAVTQTSATKTTAPVVTASTPAVKPREEIVATKPAVKEERKAIPVKPVAENTPKADSSKKSYVVAKGDTPLKIAKKFKVPFDDLLTANKIDDPTKLKIGQKLIIPVKATTTTKSKKSE
jgi:LysM repeat protein